MTNAHEQMIRHSIEWEEPPPRCWIRRWQTGRRLTHAAFVDELKSRPGQWAVYRREAGTPPPSGVLKIRFPGTEWTSRRNSDGTYAVYGRWTPRTPV